MKIIFSKDQSDRIHALASELTIAEVDEAMEPSGYSLRVEVGNTAYGHEAHIEIGSRCISLGEVEIEN